MQPKILYQDDDILAINKSAGLLVHGDGKKKEKTKNKTLVNWLEKKFPSIKNVGEKGFVIDGENVDRSGIVHRLDKDTSGVMLVAKTQKGFDCLKEQFKNREIKKTYHLFVYGTPKDSRGIIDKPIGRSGSDFRARSAENRAKGETREAITQYVVKSSSKISGETYSFVHAMPKTGRTHQIRVHFKLIRHPLVGDKMYSKMLVNKLGFDRTALHSAKVQFTNCEGKEIQIEAPYPEDFANALKRFSK